MATAAREFAERQLTPEALSCYWLKAIAVYSKVYYADSMNDIPRDINFDLTSRP